MECRKPSINTCCCYSCFHKPKHVLVILPSFTIFLFFYHKKIKICLTSKQDLSNLITSSIFSMGA